MSKNGFLNEEMIANYLNGKLFSQLNWNMKKFISYMFPDISESDIIESNTVWWSNKSDIYVCVRNKKYNISIKEWSGNSVHQEPVEEFISFLQKNYTTYYESIKYKALHEQKWQPFDIEKYIIPEFELARSDTDKRNFQFDFSSHPSPFYIFSENAKKSPF